MHFLKSAEGLIESILITSNSIFEGHDEIKIMNLQVKQQNYTWNNRQQEWMKFVEVMMMTWSCPKTFPMTKMKTGVLKTRIDFIKEKSELNYVVSSSNCIYEKENFHYLPDFSTSLLHIAQIIENIPIMVSDND